MAASSVSVRWAGERHVDGIVDLIRPHARQGRMLPRSPVEIRAGLAGFRVITDATDRVLAAGGLRRYDAGTAEVIGLVVGSASRGAGLGGHIVAALVADARREGVRTLFALTLEPAFFSRHGFRRGSVAEVPQKVAADCDTCPLRYRCAEIAMFRYLGGASRAR